MTLGACASLSGLEDLGPMKGQGGAGVGGMAVGGESTVAAGGTTAIGSGGLGGMGVGGAGAGGTGGSGPCLDAADVHVGMSCYRIMTNDADYLTAEADCQAITNGAHLAALSTVVEFDQVVTAISGVAPASMWIGADDMAIESNFVWRNGEAWTFTPMVYPWAATEPNNESNNENCVELVVLLTPHINDNTCSNLLQHLCEYPAM
ncbi:MAG: C-type lectin domain-containing protein [Polyangiaceae bacterium]